MEKPKWTTMVSPKAMTAQVTRQTLEDHQQYRRVINGLLSELAKETQLLAEQHQGYVYSASAPAINVQAFTQSAMVVTASLTSIISFPVKDDSPRPQNSPSPQEKAAEEKIDRIIDRVDATGGNVIVHARSDTQEGEKEAAGVGNGAASQTTQEGTQEATDGSASGGGQGGGGRNGHDPAVPPSNRPAGGIPSLRDIL